MQKCRFERCYTKDIKRRPKCYKCKKFQQKFLLGGKETYLTIEELKAVHSVVTYILSRCTINT